MAGTLLAAPSQSSGHRAERGSHSPQPFLRRDMDSLSIVMAASPHLTQVEPVICGALRFPRRAEDDAFL